MKTNFEPCFCLDLGALRGEDMDSADTHGGNADSEITKQSCAGKTLLMMSSRGIEVVNVPTLLH
jgi:hypothetical protein